MAMAKSSPMLKVLGLAVGVVFLVLLLNVFSGKDEPSVQQGDRIKAPPSLRDETFDNRTEEIKKLTANLTQLSAQLESLQEENRQLRESGARIEKDLDQRLQDKLKQQSQAQTQALRDEIAKSQQNQRSLIDELSKNIDNRFLNLPADQTPGGIGLEPQPGDPDYVVSEPIDTGDEIEWVQPLTIGGGGDASAFPGGGIFFPPESNTGAGFEDDFAEAPAEAEEEPVNPRPVYTIPENATLLDSTAMTALIGRVPFQGQVQDPLRFKVLIGGDNLATNGIRIPGVIGMVASGVAVGDWTLSCVRGTIDTMTFTFEDGTIHTVSESGAATGEQGSGMGFLSDPFGIPCIAGERVSNASSFLAGRAFAAGVEALSGALAKAETEEEPSNNAIAGDNATNITGDAGRFAIFEALRGTANEIGEYFRERAAQSFDVIFVRTGAKVAIHIDKQIEIDFDREGRKVFHDEFTTTNLSGGLD